MFFNRVSYSLSLISVCSSLLIGCSYYEVKRNNRLFDRNIDTFNHQYFEPTQFNDVARKDDNLYNLKLQIPRTQNHRDLDIKSIENKPVRSLLKEEPECEECPMEEEKGYKIKKLDEEMKLVA